MRKAYKQIKVEHRISGSPPRRYLLLALLIASFLAVNYAAAQADSQASIDSGRPTRSLTLSRAVELAMQNNRRLKLARLSVEDNEAKRAIARANYYPHIKNESTVLHVTELEGIDIPAGAFGNSAATGLIPGRSLRIGQGSVNTYTSGTGLVQPLTQMFKIHAGDRAATADVLSAQIDETDAENSISLLVHQMYFNILTAQAHLEATKRAASAASVNESENTRAVAEGRSLNVAALQAHAAYLDQQQSVLTQELAIDDATLQFDDVLGLPLGTRLILDGDSLGAAPTLPSRHEAIAAVTANNPKVLAARQTVEKAKAGVTAARDAYIPDISGLARYSYQSGIPFLVHNFGTFGGAFTYDLFDGGTREAKLRQARIELQMAETQLQQTEANVAIEISAAYDKTEQLQQLIAVVNEALKARVEAARVSSQRVEQNADLASSAAKADAAVYDTKASLLETQLGLFLAQNNIQQMLGQRP
ncbi:TolC family protein [Granulicella sp. WH15]|uniref:TolC family protein n=1 Tax=Granulicella sp. WH15 TaxID=2602070 RepID=UPI00136713DD|nr:TolC family protein [Granulicella sp. WH15]QHN03763.1 TolC family protein [Granulicella sp. WH15]